jgi:protein phosphatase
VDIVVEHPCVIVLAGPSGVGKSTWARANFSEDTIVESDWCRWKITGDAGDQGATADAFELVHTMMRMRLAHGQSVVVDSTALAARDRASLLEVATEAGVDAHLVVFEATERECLKAQETRERQVPEAAIKRHVARLNELVGEVRSGATKDEGFTSSTIVPRAMMATTGVRFETAVAPGYDVFGDVHGCAAELVMLLDRLGYQYVSRAWEHPDGRIAIFVGDLTDRGPANLEVLRIVQAMVRRGSARLGALGNHDWKLYRLMVEGRRVQIRHGLETTVAEFEALPHEEREGGYALVKELFQHAPAYTQYDGGRLVVTHGAMRAEWLGARWSRGRHDKISNYCLYGESGGIAENGRPIRTYDWIESWSGSESVVVFGHDVRGYEPEWMNENVVGIDTGCCFGGRLTAYRHPEREFVQTDSLHHTVEHESLVVEEPTEVDAGPDASLL